MLTVRAFRNKGSLQLCELERKEAKVREICFHNSFQLYCANKRVCTFPYVMYHMLSPKQGRWFKTNTWIGSTDIFLVLDHHWLYCRGLRYLYGLKQGEFLVWFEFSQIHLYLTFIALSQPTKYGSKRKLWELSHGFSDGIFNYSQVDDGKQTDKSEGRSRQPQLCGKSNIYIIGTCSLTALSARREGRMMMISKRHISCVADHSRYRSRCTMPEW